MERRAFLIPTWETAMAHRGPSPLARKLGHTANADWTEVADRPFEGPSPDLPKLPNRVKYHPLVTTWWDMVRHMPHCAQWSPTDWQYAVETALLKHYFWTDAVAGEVKITAASEIRKREDNIGTTAEARRKLRIRYVDVDEDDFEDEEPAGPASQPEVVSQRHAGGARPVTSLASRRARAIAEQGQADTA
jgi:hypothetical protein